MSEREEVQKFAQQHPELFVEEKSSSHSDDMVSLDTGVVEEVVGYNPESGEIRIVIQNSNHRQQPEEEDQELNSNFLRTLEDCA